MIRRVGELPERQRLAITAVGVLAGLAFVLVATLFPILAFNVVDAETIAYLAVPVAIVVVSGVCGVLGRRLSRRTFPSLLIGGIVLLGLSLAALAWAFLEAIAGIVV